MDWPKDQKEIDAMERIAELERSFSDGRYRRMAGYLAGVLDFGTLGNAHSIGALRNKLDPSLFPETEGEVARVRQHDPVGYYAGQASNALVTALAFPPLAALQAGAAIYNNPAVQRYARDAYRGALQSLPGRSLAVIGSMPFAVRDALRANRSVESVAAEHDGRNPLRGPPPAFGAARNQLAGE